MTKAALRSHLAVLVQAGAARSPSGAGRVLPLASAFAVVDALAASDSAPEWKYVLAGAEELHQVMAIYRTWDD
jgi:hypothetical protein